MFRPLCLLLSLLALLVDTPSLLAQDPAAPLQQDPQTTVEALQTRIEATRADSTLADEIKTPLLETLQKALDNAKSIRTRREAARHHDDLRASAAERLADRRRELEAIDENRGQPKTSGLGLTALEQGLTEAQQRQQKAQARAAALDAEKARRSSRRTAIPEQLNDLRRQLTALPAQPTDPAPDVDARAATARRLLMITERDRLQAEIEALTAELAAYDAEVDLLRTEADVAARTVTAAKADADAWLAVLQPLREREAERFAKAAREQAIRADPQIAPIAEENARLARLVAELATRSTAVELEKASRGDELSELKERFAEIENRVQLVGSDERIGTLLRRQRSLLADTSKRHQQRTRSRRDRIIDAQLSQIDYDERRRRVVEDPDGWLEKQLGGDEAVAALTPALLTAARDLVKQRRDLLQQLTDGYRQLLDNEVAVETTERQLTELIAAYRTYVTERVLGIRSSQPIWHLDLAALLASAAWLTDAAAWLGLLETTAALLLGEIWPLLILLLLLVVLGMRGRLRRHLTAHGERAARGTNVAYLPTALAAVMSFLLVLPLPAILLLWGWRLSALPTPGDFERALAPAMAAFGLSLAMALMVRVLALPRGLAEAHFQWQGNTVALLRRVVPQLFLVAVLTLLLVALQHHGDQDWLGSLGELLLTAQLLVLMAITRRLLHPVRGIIGGRFKPVPGPIYRFRRLWYLLAMALLLTLFSMTVLGYDYTVQQLQRRTFHTIGVIVLAVLVHAMILRGLVLERRRLQIRHAKARLQAAKEGDAAAEPEAGQSPDPQLLTRQTQTMLVGAIVIALAVAIYQIWADVMPALGLLRGVELWNIGTDDLPQWITLADALLGAFLLAASLTAARNLPALLEMFVLQRLKMQGGERNAITTLTRYAIIILGVLWSFSSIGVSWNKVQWLIAAVSVGLGFGLQEIFANFVSGLILLFERPIRVGDLVTVGETTGRVTRIQIRATTILDWTRKELVVPNREFVTSRFVNWTLGDPVVRYTVPVGVAYGSDTQRAIELLTQAAAGCARVLDDPAPNAYFVGFGDSTLNLELRIFIDIDTVEWHWTTDVHQAIDKAFRAAGIEIAFPQRDVHLKLPDNFVASLRGADAATAN